MLAGSSASTSAGSTASARAMQTRWRCPPESWWGYLAGELGGGGQPHALQQGEHPLLQLGVRSVTRRCRQQRPLQVVGHACGPG